MDHQTLNELYNSIHDVHTIQTTKITNLVTKIEIPGYTIIYCDSNSIYVKPSHVPGIGDSIIINK